MPNSWQIGMSLAAMAGMDSSEARIVATIDTSAAGAARPLRKWAQAEP